MTMLGAPKCSDMGHKYLLNLTGHTRGKTNDEDL